MPGKSSAPYFDLYGGFGGQGIQCNHYHQIRKFKMAEIQDGGKKPYFCLFSVKFCVFAMPRWEKCYRYEDKFYRLRTCFFLHNICHINTFSTCRM